MNAYTLTKEEAAQWDGGAIEHDEIVKDLMQRFDEPTEVSHPDDFVVDVFGADWEEVPQ